MSVGRQWLELHSLLQERDRFLNLPEIRNHGREANLRFCSGRLQLKRAPVFGFGPFAIAIDADKNLSQCGMAFGRVGIFGYCALGGSPGIAVGSSHIVT